ncbi:MAG: hypothetical protein WCA38_14780 [Candidatus Acidiferrales bacterium]
MPDTNLALPANAIPDRPRVSVAFWVIVFLVAGGLAVRNLSTWPARMFYPGEESYEGSALVEITRLAQGVPIYAPPSENGFAAATYGPLYYVVGSRLVDPRILPIFTSAYFQRLPS